MSSSNAGTSGGGVASSAGNGNCVVTVQRHKVDNSFKAQIEQLRHENDADYDLFDRPPDHDPQHAGHGSDKDAVEAQLLDMFIRVVVHK